MNTRVRLWWPTGFSTWCCLCVLLLALPSAMADHPVADDSLLKTAFIYNFAKFTRWPLDSWDDSKTPLNICTVGSDNLVNKLNRLSEETIRGRLITISLFAPGVGAKACHMLYVALSEQRHFTRFIQQTRDGPVLTVSQIDRFAESGGIIQLYGGKQGIRFKINREVAHSRGLNLSARLLDLAELVETRVMP